jgi:hypothetical protein
VWRNAKQAVARIIGTQAATDAAGAALAAVLADAAAADAARPLAGGTTGLSGGVYFLYACDVVVSAVTKRAAGELPAGTTTDHLTTTFACARVLRLLAGAHAYLAAHPLAAQGAVAAVSLAQDAAALALIALSVLGRSTRPVIVAAFILAARGVCALLVAQPQAGLNALEGAARLFATALTQCAREGMPQGALAQMAVVLRGYKGAMGEGPWGALWGGLALPTREELRKVIPEQPL